MKNQTKDKQDSNINEENKENKSPSVTSIQHQYSFYQNKIINGNSPIRSERSRSLTKSKYSVKTASNRQNSREIEVHDDNDRNPSNSIISIKPMMVDQSIQ